MYSKPSYLLYYSSRVYGGILRSLRPVIRPAPPALYPSTTYTDAFPPLYEQVGCAHGERGLLGQHIVEIRLVPTKQGSRCRRHRRIVVRPKVCSRNNKSRGMDASRV